MDAAAALQIDFEGGETALLGIGAGEPLLMAARRAGVAMASDCRRGQCKTCRCTLSSGSVAYPADLQTTLTAEDMADGAVLPCVARATSDVRIRAPYSRESLLPLKSKSVEIAAIERLSEAVVRLRCTLAATTRIDFLPGQHCMIQIPGSSEERRYFIASSQRDWPEMDFLIRLRPGGLMSDYLATRAAVGEKIRIRAPLGGFHLRQMPGPMLMVAGGVGIVAMLSMLSALKHQAQTETEILLLHEASAPAGEAYREAIAGLAANFPRLELRSVTVETDSRRGGVQAGVADRIGAADAARLAAGGSAYLCGPPEMVTAARRRLAELGLEPARLHAEEVIAAEPAKA